jgi:hypothetical protein
MWKNSVKCRVMNYARNFINILVEDSDKGDWRLTCYYGYPGCVQVSVVQSMIVT